MGCRKGDVKVDKATENVTSKLNYILHQATRTLNTLTISSTNAMEDSQQGYYTAQGNVIIQITNINIGYAMEGTFRPSLWC